MTRTNYKVRTTATYEVDLENAVFYIKDVLHNKTAAIRLIRDIESAILDRSYSPFLFRPYPRKNKHKEEYYPIYVRNYIVFYVIIGDVMEVRRLIYCKRNIEHII